jgi:molybdopterin molybdotransferase
MKLLSVVEARTRMLAAVAPVAMEAAALDEALGRVLAAPVVAGRDQPPFAASAMDGWAVRAADTPGILEIVGESAAGAGFGGEMTPGQVVRIFTGAPLPAGADAVVMQEDARREGQSVSVPATPPERHVRAAGLDFKAGERLLETAQILDPWRLSLAAAAGAATLQVRRRPHVGVIATGPELVAPGAEPAWDQIFNSGSTALAALIRASGGQPMIAAPVADDAGAIAAAASRVAGDLLVIVGGASVGDHDLAKPALASHLGLELAVESVAVRPGKPTWFGRLGDGRPVLGLPGNPASALVCAELFLKPLIAALLGLPTEPRLEIAATEAALPANGPREHWMRARTWTNAEGRLRAQALADQDSSLVKVFASADSLVRRAADAPAAAAGQAIEILRLRASTGSV